MNLLVLFLTYSDAFQNGFDIDNKQLFSKAFTKYYIKAEHWIEGGKWQWNCLKKGFVQILRLWFLSWHPTPCLSYAMFPDPSQLRCLWDGEWWERASLAPHIWTGGRQRGRDSRVGTGTCLWAQKIKGPFVLQGSLSSGPHNRLIPPRPDRGCSKALAAGSLCPFPA